jgi:hypothetical protein
MASAIENKSDMVAFDEAKVDPEQPALEGRGKGSQVGPRTLLEVGILFSF